MTRQISNPTLTLFFIGKDLMGNHATVQTISREFIVYNSISFSFQLLNELKSSSNRVSLQIRKKADCITDILQTESDIKAVLNNNETTLFTGYLSTNFNWSVTTTGETALNITIEDVGTRLLGKTFIKNGKHLFNCSANNAIREICKVANIEIDEDCPILSDKVINTIDSAKTCKEILEQLLYELGYVYHFNAYGKLLVFKIDSNDFNDSQIVDKDNLTTINNTAINLSKRIKKYNDAHVTFTKIRDSSNYLIYRNTSGNDDSHPFCNFKLNSGEGFDGTEIYSAQQLEDNKNNTYREPAIIEACNANSESEIVGSNKIIAISNVRLSYLSQSSNIQFQVSEAGGPGFKLFVQNKGPLSYYITKLDIYADILFEKDICVIRTSKDEYNPEESDNIIKEKLEFVHDEKIAKKHANLLCQYHRFCGASYSFSSKKDLVLGKVITLIDNIFSGLFVNVLLTAKTFRDGSDVIKYSAVGISQFNLDAPIFHQTINSGQGNTTGKPGKDGYSYTIQITSTNGNTFRFGDINTTLNCSILQNNKDITSTLEDYRFKWKRISNNKIEDEIWNTSSKAIGHKKIDITSLDCNGRTVFNCEVEI